MSSKAPKAANGDETMMDAGIGLMDSGKRISAQQMEKAINMVKKRKSAREQAKAEEANYVEHRKAMVLAKCQPRVGTQRILEDMFPKPRGSMVFGERKAHYLSIRPNPKYAVWIGKKKGVIEAKARVAVPVSAIVTDHSALPSFDNVSTRSKTESSKGVGDKEKSWPNKKNRSLVLEPVEKSTIEILPDENAERKGGKCADNPLVNGVPFWTIGMEQQQDITDDESPIDADAVEKFFNAGLHVKPIPTRAASFNPYGHVQRFQQDDHLFNRETTLRERTMQSIILLQVDETDEQISKETAATTMVPKIKFSSKLTYYVFDPTERSAGTDGPFVEDLRDIKRVGVITEQKK